MNTHNKQKTIAFALCGSYCSFADIMPQIKVLKNNWNILPVMSFAASNNDTRFGTADYWKKELSQTTGNEVLTSLQGVEPLGPKKLADAMVVAPCTGVTVAKIALGISNTPVTLGVKSMLRGGCPIILAVSTNDGLGASLENIAMLLQRKNIYFVPFGQDDYEQKPFSLKADFNLIEKTIEKALNKEQIQPILLK